MFEVYFEVFYPMWVDDSLGTLKVPYWIPLATTHLVGGNRNLMLFGGILSIMWRIVSSSCPWYHWLPLATTHLVGDNREFLCLYFEGFYPL